MDSNTLVPQPVVSLATPAPIQNGRVRLQFLDGLRGLSACYVVLSHIGAPHNLPFVLSLFWAWTGFGRSAVSVFIVLSGFSLMLPVARSSDGTLKGGFGEYIKRRSMRILPPYYAALGIIIILLLMAKGIGNSIGDWSHNVHANDLGPGNIITHLLLVHNLFQQWNSGIESSMWSIPVEWQIYFLFPLVLLPVWRRYGIIAPIIVGLLIGIIPLFVLPAHLNFSWCNPWFVGLFAMGMAGATICFSSKPRMDALLNSLHWGSITAISAGIFVFISILRVRTQPGMFHVGLDVGSDICLGIATTCLIVFCTRHGKTPTITRQPFSTLR